MGFCLIGAAFIIGITIYSSIIKDFNLCSYFGLLIATLFFALGIFSTPFGFEEPVCIAIEELQPLNHIISNDKSEQTYYLSVKHKDNNDITYCYCKKVYLPLISSEDQCFELMSLTGNVSIIIENVEFPIVEIYEVKPIKSFWSFSKYREYYIYTIKVQESQIKNLFITKAEQ